jgi:L-amino acid N-acyltransferase YncA
MKNKKTGGIIRDIDPGDALQICDIYNHYVLNSIITFEEEPVSVHEMCDRIEFITRNHPWLVFEHDSIILGYAYGSDWKSRSAYKHSVESTVYLKYDQPGNQIGSMLYAELIKRLSKQKFHAIIGGIALPNDASIALHEKFGFEKIANFREVGYKFDQWIDVGYWELILT